MSNLREFSVFIQADGNGFSKLALFESCFYTFCACCRSLTKPWGFACPWWKASFVFRCKPSKDMGAWGLEHSVILGPSRFLSFALRNELSYKTTALRLRRGLMEAAGWREQMSTCSLPLRRWWQRETLCRRAEISNQGHSLSTTK